MYYHLIAGADNFTSFMAYIDGCNPEVDNGGNWPETDLGSRASAPCLCSEFAGSLAGRQYRRCEGTYSQKARWSNVVDVSECAALNDRRTGLLCKIAHVRSACMHA